MASNPIAPASQYPRSDDPAPAPVPVPYQPSQSHSISVSVPFTPWGVPSPLTQYQPQSSMRPKQTISFNRPVLNRPPSSAKLASLGNSSKTSGVPIEIAMSQLPQQQSSTSSVSVPVSLSDHDYDEETAAASWKSVQSQLIDPFVNDKSEKAERMRHLLFVRAVIGEFFATSIFMTVNFGNIVSAERQGWNYEMRPLIGAIVAGLVASLVILTFAPISGAHFNPAVTFACWIAKRTDTKKAAFFILAQLLGSVFAMCLISIVIPTPTDYYDTLTVTPPDNDYTRVMFMEFFLSFLFIYMVFTVAIHQSEVEKRQTMSVRSIASSQGLTLYASSPNTKSAYAFLGIGAAIACLSLLGSSVSGGVFNPARLFGPALFSGQWAWQWLYWISELSGAACAALLAERLNLHSIGTQAGAENMPSADQLTNATMQRAAQAAMESYQSNALAADQAEADAEAASGVVHPKAS